ncbi:MAG: arsenate reductase ArsC [Acetobacterium sp.]|nr:arsenate reductase ArsC [Acetobacterium sp.]
MNKPKVAFICVHNSCRSQMAEALSKKFASDVFESYSAGTEIKPQINQDAVRLIKERYNIDMETTQHSKLLTDLPAIDIIIKMGCNVVCPYLPSRYTEDWGLEDPSGKSDKEFVAIIDKIETNIKKLTTAIKNNELALT